MASDIQVGSTSKKMMWAGYAVSALPVLMLLMGVVMTFANPQMVTDGIAKLGYPEGIGLCIRDSRTRSRGDLRGFRGPRCSGRS